VLKTLPNFDPPTKALYQLASTPLDPATFRIACEQFAQYKPDSDDDLWCFSLGASGANLLVGVDVEWVGRVKPDGRWEFRYLRVNRAILSVCWWEHVVRKDQASEERFAREEAQFHKVYDDALTRAVGDIGSPLLQGADTNCYFHRWAIWRGETALLVLQESSYDAQFWLDINFWIRPWSGGDLRPTSPFFDWLEGEQSMP
jgi:hypothetical protein